MTDRLTPEQLRDLADHADDARMYEFAIVLRSSADIRDEAARREAQQKEPLECPACGGSGHVEDFKARREAEGGIPAEHLQHALDTMPEAARGFAKLAASLTDAPPPTAPDFSAMIYGLKVASTEDVWREQRANLLDAIEALRARAEAAEAELSGIKATLTLTQRQLDDATRELGKAKANLARAESLGRGYASQYRDTEKALIEAKALLRDAEADAKRLRGALEKIAESSGMTYAGQIARNALAGGNDG